ncbi:hypothetical protein OSB04_019214, partial [Centaurea solstitialis]
MGSMVYLDCLRFSPPVPEDNNSVFLGSLGPEWIHLTMSMRTTLDLEGWTLSDVFGSLKSQENQVMQMKRREGLEKKKDEKEKKKKKKVLVVESEDSSEDEPSMKDLVKALALMTREYRRGRDRREYRGTERRSFREGGRSEESAKRNNEERREEEKKITYRSEGQKKEEVKDGCFKSDCWSKAPKTSKKGPRDAAYFKRKADNLVTDESSEDEAQRGLFAWEESDTEDEIFCGMAKVDEEASNLVTSE